VRKVKNISVIIIGVLGLVLFSCKQKPPRASFVFSQENGGIVHFSNTSAGEITKLKWDFGDNSANAEEIVATSPTHRFLLGGTYKVSLMVENEGGKDTYMQDVTIISGDREAIEDYPVFDDAEGYFYARNRYEFDPITPGLLINIKASALVTMYDTTNFLVAIGAVNVNGQGLTNNSDNSYSFHSEDSSWYFNEGVRWSAEGGSKFPTIVENIGSVEFPDISAIVSPKTFVRGIDTVYNMRVKDPIFLADSVKFRIETINGTLIVEKRSEGGFSGVAFTQTDLLKLTRGDYITKVIAFSYERQVYNFKPVYFTKESYTESTLSVR
jgi:PKD repeat protein|tara:strand:- start:999 stop:1973 length:975 start_codon:yes stop_codon:yes gene_type:complete